MGDSPRSTILRWFLSTESRSSSERRGLRRPLESELGHYPLCLVDFTVPCGVGSSGLSVC